MSTEFKAKLKSIRFGSVPGGTKSGQVDEITNREAGWDKDIPAYKRLRKEGIQPRNIDGAAELEAKANTEWEIENRILTPDASIPETMKKLEAETGQKDVGVHGNSS